LWCWWLLAASTLSIATACQGELEAVRVAAIEVAATTPKRIDRHEVQSGEVATMLLDVLASSLMAKARSAMPLG